MKCVSLGIAGVFLVILICSSVYAGPIVINTADVGDLSNYLSDPLFTPYFGSSATILDFEGSWSAPDTTNSYFDLGAVGTTYNSQGVDFGLGATFMGGQPGFGYITPNTVVGSAGAPYDGPIDISLVMPGTNTPASVQAIGAFVADGPTNETSVSFYDIYDHLLGTINADPNVSDVFLGWSDNAGISRVEFTNGAGDDYYIDNLTFQSASVTSTVPVPAAMLLASIGLGCCGWFRELR